MSQRTTTEIRHIIAAMPPELHTTGTATVLRDAATYLATHGWTQGEYYTDESITGEAVPPCACVLGAIWTTVYPKCGLQPDDDELNELTPVRALAWYLHGTRAELPDQVIATWNDVEGQTADHVIDTLAAVALWIAAAAARRSSTMDGEP